MLLTYSDKPPDVFQDGYDAGIKELFEEHEAELLPIGEQLHRYKKRDLYSSHFYRTSCKVFGPRKNTRRLHFINDDPFDTAVVSETSSAPRISDNTKLPPYYASKEQQPNVQKRSTAFKPSEDKPKDEYKSWLSERRKLRNGLNNLGLEASWLMRKPDKTILEERVLANLQSSGDHNYDKFSGLFPPSLPSKAGTTKPPNSVLKVLRKLGKYIAENKLPKSNIFNHCGQINTITHKQCKEGLTMLQEKLGVLSSNIDDVLYYFFKDREISDTFNSTLLETIKSIDPSFSTTSIQSSTSRISLTSNSTISIKDYETSQKTTFEEPTNALKEARLKEYNEIVKLCKERGVLLTENLLRKVLLHPGDQPLPPNRKFRIRQPAESLSKDFWKTAEKKKLKKKKHKRKPKKLSHSEDFPVSNSMHSDEDFNSSLSQIKSDSTSKFFSDTSLNSSNACEILQYSSTNECNRTEKEISKAKIDVITQEKRSEQDNCKKDITNKHQKLPEQITTESKTNEEADKHLSVSLINSTNDFLQESAKFSVQDILQYSNSVSSESYHKYENRITKLPKIKQCCAPSSKGLMKSSSHVLPAVSSNNAMQATRDSSLNLTSGKFSFTHKRRNDDSSSTDEDTRSDKPKKKETTIVNFPRLRDVAPERHQMNLSTGRALVGRKVDCWLSFEEYEKLTNGTVDLPLRRGRAIPNAFWPGQLLDKMRLYMSPCNDRQPCDKTRSKRTIFHQNRPHPPNGRRTNYGYDNNELTWPTNGNYVQFGDIELNKVYHL